MAARKPKAVTRKRPEHDGDTIPGKAVMLYRRHDTPTLGILTAVNALWREIQVHNPGTPNVAIVLQASEYAHGHFAPGSWEGSAHHELMLSTVSLSLATNRGEVIKTVSTLLHEAAHAYAYENGLKDTSRQGRWHNKVFAQLATQFGCEVQPNAQIGHTTDGITAQARALYAKHIDALMESVTTYRRMSLMGGIDLGKLIGLGVGMRTRTRKPAPPRGTVGARNVSVSCDCGPVTVLARLAESATITCNTCGKVYE
jgi:SprT-like family.